MGYCIGGWMLQTKEKHITCENIPGMSGNLLVDLTNSNRGPTFSPGDRVLCIQCDAWRQVGTRLQALMGHLEACLADGNWVRINVVVHGDRGGCERRSVRRTGVSSNTKMKRLVGITVLHLIHLRH